jgi:hypothetical protein
MDRRSWHDHWTDILSGVKLVEKNGIVLPLKMRSPKHVVFTATSTTSLGDAVRTVNTAFKKLRRSVLFTKGMVTTQNRVRHPVLGGVVVGETTISEFTDGVRYHYHLHALLDCYFLPMAELGSAWSRVIGSLGGHACSGAVHLGKNDKISSVSDYVHYITEYIGKPVKFTRFNCLSTASFDEKQSSAVRSSLPSLVADTYRTVMLGRRLIWSFGRYYDFTLHKKTPSSCPECGSLDVHVYHVDFNTGWDVDSALVTFHSPLTPDAVDNGVP